MSDIFDINEMTEEDIKLQYIQGNPIVTLQQSECSALLRDF